MTSPELAAPASRHLPHRDSEVEAWGRRETWSAGGREWIVIDELLDDYRLRADYGATLTDDVCDLEP